MNSANASYLCFAGIDVCKDYLDLHLLPGNKAQRFPNAAAGHRALIAVLKADKTRLLAIEATGGYEHAAVVAMVCAGVRVHVAQPQVVRAFAKSLGLRAKNDKIDAAVCARYARDRCSELRVIEKIDKTHEKLQALVMRRDQLVGMQTMEQNRVQQASDRETLGSHRRALKWLEGEITRIEKTIDQTIKADEVLNAKSEALQTLDGVAAQTARLMIALLPELGRECDRRLNSLVGVAPFAVDSGPRKGTRCISGGRTPVRNALYMSTLTASYKNPAIAAHYRKKRSEGKEHKAAMIPCMRKQLALMNRTARLAMEAMRERMPQTA